MLLGYPYDDLEEGFENNEPMIILKTPTMICSVVTTESGKELYFWRQDHTGMPVEHYHVPERLINEIRECETEEVQNVIQKICSTCNRIL